jgi:hypothetical protein
MNSPRYSAAPDESGFNSVSAIKPDSSGAAAVARRLIAGRAASSRDALQSDGPGCEESPGLRASAVNNNCALNHPMAVGQIS